MQVLLGWGIAILPMFIWVRYRTNQLRQSLLLIVLTGWALYPVILGAKADTAAGYATTAIVPLALIVIILYRAVGTDIFRITAIIAILVSALFLPFTAFGVALGTDGGLEAGQLGSNEDGTRAVGYAIREWRENGEINYTGQVRGWPSSTNVFSTKPGDYFYTTLETRYISSNSPEQIRTNLRQINQSRAEGYGLTGGYVGWRVEQTTSSAPPSDIIVILYREDLNGDFTWANQYLQQQNGINRSLVVRHNGQTEAVVFTSMVEESRTVEAHQMAELYRHRYGSLRDYGDLYLGIY